VEADKLALFIRKKNTTDPTATVKKKDPTAKRWSRLADHCGGRDRVLFSE
jgi:hypothetical protein